MKTRRWLRISGIAAASVVVVIAVLFAALQTAPARRLIIAAIEDAVSSETLRVQIVGLEGTLPGAPRATKVWLADAHGPWLALDNVSVSWSPFALLFGEIVVDDVVIDRVHWLRQPASAAAESEGSNQRVGRTPSLRIGHLKIQTLNIAPEVAGSPGALRVEGHADLLDLARAATIRLDIAQIAGDARVSADLRYALDQSLLVTQFDVQDKPGGVLASLVGLPPGAPLSVQVRSTGTLDDWRATLTARGGGALEGNGSATLRRAGDWRTLSAALETGIGSIGPAALRPLFAGHTRLTLGGAYGPDGRYRVDRVKLEAPALHLEGSGDFDPTSKKADGSVTVSVPDGAKLSPLLGEGIRWSDLVATARLNGAWPKPVLNIDVTSSALQIDTIKAGAVTVVVHATPDRAWNEAGLQLASTAFVNATGVQANDPLLGKLLGPTVSVKAQAAVDGNARLSNASVEARAAAGTARIVGEVGDESVAGDLTVDAPDLGRAGLHGRGLLRARLHFVRATSSWEVEGTGSAENLAIGDDTVDALLKGKTDLQVAAEGASLHEAKISRLALVGPRVSVEAQGLIGAEKLDASAHAILLDAAMLSNDIAGRIEAQLRAGGSMAKLQFEGTISLSRGKVLDQASQLLVLRLDEMDASGVGAVALNGDLGGKAVLANAAVAWNEPKGIRFDKAHVALGSVELDGAVTLKEGLLTGGFALNAGALRDIGPLADVELAGRAVGKLMLAGVGGQQIVDVALTSGDARVDTVQMTDVAVTGRLIDPFGKIALDLRAQSASADVDGFVLTRVDATGKGKLDALDVAATALRQETAVATQGRLNVHQHPTLIAINALSLVRGNRQARLEAPVVLAVAGGRVSIPSARISAGGGQLVATGSVGHQIDLVVKAERLPLWLSELAGESLPVTGLASGTVTLSGPARERRGTFELKLASLTPEDARGVARNLTLAATGTTNRDGAVFKATLSDPRGMTLNASGRVPFMDAGTFAIDLQGSGELALANVYLAATGDRARGKLAVSAKVSGTLAAPQVNGTGTIKDGFFRSAQAGLELRDIEARFEGSERRIAVTELSAKAPNGGMVTGRGEIKLDRATGFPIDLSLKAADAQLVATDITTVSAGLDVRMSGGLMQTPVIRGTVDISQWDIHVPERLARPLTPIRVTHRNAPAYVTEAAAHENEAQSALSFGLDLTVRAPRRVYVRGQGIDAEFGGTAKVAGNVDDPIVTGKFDLRRGAISLLSERIALTRGAVVFSGPVEPTLDVAGTISKSDITATIAAKGKASDPVLTLTSTPTLPQDEILARILFRKGTQQLSVFEAAELAQAIAKWSGLSAGPDILDKLRTALGIDALSATTDSSGATAVSAGSYVGSGLFVGMTQGAASQSGAASVEVELNEHIKLRGEANANGNAKLGVASEWEY